MFCFFSPHYYCQLCAPRKSRWRSVPWSVCVCLTCQRSQKFDTSWYSACLCILVPVGGPYAGGALSAFVRVPRQQKTYCHVLFVILCHVCIFSCQINNFQVQVQVMCCEHRRGDKITSPSLSVNALTTYHIHGTCAPVYKQILAKPIYRSGHGWLITYTQNNGYIYIYIHIYICIYILTSKQPLSLTWTRK